MAKKSYPTAWAPGVSGNPKGRPPALLPEVTSLINQTRNTARVMIIQKLHEQKLSDYLDKVIRIGGDMGDVQALKTLLELALGKMVVEIPEFEVTEEEKAVVLEFRRLKALHNAGKSIGIDEDK